MTHKNVCRKCCPHGPQKYGLSSSTLAPRAKIADGYLLKLDFIENSKPGIRKELALLFSQNPKSNYSYFDYIRKEKLEWRKF